MGVRLYPATTDAARLEALCGVPAGTAARLEALEAEHGTKAEGLTLQEADRRAWELHKALCEEPAVDKYHDFLVYGWGRFRNPIEGMDPNVGRFEPGPDADRVLFLNGISASADLAEGLRYC